MTVKRVLPICSAILVAGVLVASGVVGSRVKNLRNPPIGRQIFAKENYRLYQIDGVDEAKISLIKDWGARWGGRVGHPDFGGYGGDLGHVEPVTEGGTLDAGDGKYFHVPKGSMIIVLRDVPFQWQNTWLRIRSLF